MNEDIMVRRYNSSLSKIWDEFNERAKNGLFMFCRRYMDYHSDRFMDHSLMFYEREKLIALLPANEADGCLHSHDGLTYGGFITDDNMRQKLMMECFSALYSYCLRNGIIKVLYKSIPYFYYRQPAEEDCYALFCMDASMVKVESSTVLDLKHPVHMSKLRLRQINRAVREGVTVSVDDTRNAYDSFMVLQDDVLMRRHHANAVHTGKEISLLHEQFPDNIHLYVARRDERLLGGSIIFVYDNVIHTQYLCASDEAREVGALDATVAKIIEDYVGSRHWLDFGISTEKNGHYLNEGLKSQKEGFGGRTVVYRTYELSISRQMSLGGGIRKGLERQFACSAYSERGAA